VAVLAGGHDRIYPPEHGDLAQALLANGAAVSEMPLGWEPRARDFPRRNRLISGLAAGVVIIEDCLIDGNFAGAARGISDERVGGGELYVSNTTVRNTGQIGILVVPAGGGVAGQRIDAAFDNVRVQNSAQGVVIGNNVRAMINRSVFSGHTGAGILAGGALAPIEVNVSNSVSSNNATGVQNNGGTTTIRLSTNDISFNGTALSGATQSFGNNRMLGNTSFGNDPTPIGLR